MWPKSMTTLCQYFCSLTCPEGHVQSPHSLFDTLTGESWRVDRTYDFKMMFQHLCWILNPVWPAPNVIMRIMPESSSSRLIYKISDCLPNVMVWGFWISGAAYDHASRSYFLFDNAIIQHLKMRKRAQKSSHRFSTFRRSLIRWLA